MLKQRPPLTAFEFAAERCSINGKLRDGGVRITIESWSSIMSRDSIDKHLTLLQDLKMR